MRTGLSSPVKLTSSSSSGRLPDFHHFFFFHRAQIFNLLRLRMGHLLKLFQRTLLLILANFFILLQSVDGFLDVAANVAHGSAMILEHFVNVFHQFLPTLFSRR